MQELREQCGVWSQEHVLLVKTDQVQEHWNEQGIQKFIGSDGIHPQMLRELANVIARQLLAIFGRLWCSGENSEAWKKTNIALFCTMAKKENLENLKPVNLF